MKLQFVEFDTGSKFPKYGDNKEITTSTDHNDFEDAGLLLGEEYIVVDIDSLSKDQCHALLALLRPRNMYVETDRGIHLYYKKPKGTFKNNINCWIGFPIELKQKFITIKLNGKLRDIYNKGIIDDPLPWFFQECNIPPVLDMGASQDEGRQMRLLKYKYATFEYPEANAHLQFMNDWLLAEPQEERQFRSILEATPDMSGQDQASAVQWVLMETEPVLWDGVLYLKTGEDFTSNHFLIRRKIDTMMPDLRTAEWEEIIKKIQVRGKIINGHHQFKIKFNNGFIWRGKFIYGSVNEFTPYKIDLNYNPNAVRPKAWDTFMKRINVKNDPNLEKYIFQIFGAAFEVNPRRRAKDPRVHFIVGDGGNGKGTICKAFAQIFNSEVMSTAKIHQLSDKDNVLELSNVLINIGEDLEDSPINTTIMERVKSISAADPIQLRGLYEKAKSGKIIMPVLLFTSNHILSTFEKGLSWQRRAYWLPMSEYIGDMDQEVFDGLESKECIDYILKMTIEAYLDMYENGWTECKTVKEFTDHYHKDNDPFNEYVNNHKAEDFIGKTVNEAFQLYELYCTGLGVNYGSVNVFGKKLKMHYNLNNDKTVRDGGSTTRPLRKNGEENDS